MIYMPRLNFLFLRVPRTASTTLSDVLQTGFDANANGICTPIYYKGINPNYTYSHVDIHCNINDLINQNILNEEQVNGLDIYAVIRDPIERYKSYCAHNLTYNTSLKARFETVDNLANFGYDLLTTGFKPQIHWLEYQNKTLNNIFSFKQIKKMLEHLSNRYSIKFKDLPNHRQEERNNNSVNLDKHTVEKLYRDYKKDFELYECYQ